MSTRRTSSSRTPRSLILDTTVEAVFHTALLFAIFLLFVGHNQPGGGFVGGLVAGAAFVLRYLAGGVADVRRTAPVTPETLLGVGLAVATVTGVGPLFFGDAFLESTKVDLHLPLLGDVHATTALPFDIGVFLVVLGVVLAVLHTLGGEAER